MNSAVAVLAVRRMPLSRPLSVLSCRRQYFPAWILGRLKRESSGFQAGFTLLEILVALVAAGLLAFMISAVLGRGIVASSALEEVSHGQRSRIVLYRLLSMDLRNMEKDGELTVTDQGFSLQTSHNHLLPGPLPMTVTWDFSEAGIRRTEELPDLAYTQSVVLVADLESCTLTFFDLSEKRWTDSRAWLHGTDHPAPVGIRLEVRMGRNEQWELVHRLPLEHDVPG